MFHFVGLIFKNLRRNLLRTILTALGTMALVFVVTMVWSVLDFINSQTAEKSNDFKVLVTEKNKAPSRLPRAYRASLQEGAARAPDDVKPVDYMTWAFSGGTLDPSKMSREHFLCHSACEPEKAPTMLDDLDQLGPADMARLQAGIAKMKRQANAVIIGPEQLKTMNKKVGERFTLNGLIFKDLNLEFEIVDTFPEAAQRYGQTSLMNLDYLLQGIDEFEAKNKKKLANADDPIAFVMLKVKNKTDYERLSAQIANSPLYTSPAVRCESASSAVSTFLEGWKDIFWGMKFILIPAIVITLALVIAVAISIGVRERRQEIAVLKVLGFRPGHIMFLVLGEALLIGILAGVLSSAGSYLLFNKVLGGIALPIAWFQRFFIPQGAILLGFLIGAGTALLGSLIPAWSARSVRVADVFSKVT
ncbi:MAG: ABC transporter permease [Planctomycetaceae bacterium]